MPYRSAARPARWAALSRSRGSRVVSGTKRARRRQARAYRSTSVPRRWGGATKAGLATICGRRSAAGVAASKSSRVTESWSGATMMLFMCRSPKAMPRAWSASTASVTSWWVRRAQAVCSARASAAGSAAESGKRRAKTVLSGVPGMNSMARKRCSPTVCSPCTRGTHASPSRARRAAYSRSRRVTASAPSAASPACGRPSLSTTASPVSRCEPAYTPPPLEKCRARSTVYGRPVVPWAARASACGRRKSGSSTQSGRRKAGPRVSGTRRPAGSATAGTREPSAARVKRGAKAP